MSSILENISKFKPKLDKTTRYIFLSFFLIWPWQTRYFLVSGVNEYLTTSIYASDVVVLILFLAVIFGGRGNLKGKELLRYFFVGLVPVALLAIAQYGLQDTWTTKWLGLAKHEPGELGQVVIETAQGERWLRAYGSFDHPNILGGVMAVALLLLLIQKREHWSILDSLYVLLFASALFFSFSRAGWLGLGVGLIVYLLISTVRIIRGKEQVGLLEKIVNKLRLSSRSGPVNEKRFFVLLFVAFATLSVVYSDQIFARASAGRLEQKSVSERVSYYAQAKELFLAHPLFGVGAGNYVPTLMKLQSNRPIWSYQPVHNAFDLMMVELGLIGYSLLAVLLAIFVAIFVKIAKLFKYFEIVSVFSAMATMMLFDHWWWSLHIGLIFIGLVMGISVRLIEDNN